MVLYKIVRDKRKELEEAKRDSGLGKLRDNVRLAQKRRSLEVALGLEGISLIAEVKKASPSAGIIRADFNPVETGKIYENGGAAAISVLTERKYFMGDLQFLSELRKVVSIPLLRKDFIFDEYQVYESKINGADAILLIAAILTDDKMSELIDLCETVDLEALVEVHTEEELKRVLRTNARIIGINNRNLNTLEVDLSTTEKLMSIIREDKKAKEKVIVSESGIQTPKDLKLARETGVDAVLVGEALMRGGVIEENLKRLLGE